jgi:hypothetical protein
MGRPSETTCGGRDDHSGETLAAQSSCGAGSGWCLLGVDAAGSLRPTALPDHDGDAPALYSLDAALYEPAPQRQPGQRGRPRKKGKRLATLQQVLQEQQTAWTPVTVPHGYSQHERQVEVVSACCLWYHTGMPPVPIRYVLIRDPLGNLAPQALLCTNLSADPVQVVCWFVQRWQLETTFQEVRTHLGVETQRQWSDLAILRTTPALLGLFSLVTLLAHQQADGQPLLVRQAAWYVKVRPTFSDALASGRRQLWSYSLLCTCSVKTDRQELQQVLMERFEQTLCYAA